jgi:hypothetical protein
LHLEPFGGLVISTFWAMSILAGMITVPFLVAGFTTKDLATECFSATGDDFLDDL